MATKERTYKLNHLLRALVQKPFEWIFRFRHEDYKLDQPTLVVCNHVTNFDVILASLCCPGYHMHFVASEHMFRWGTLSKLITWLVEPIARRKGEAAAKMAAAEDIVITADTMVFLGDERLGKPRDEEDALRMLTALSGAKHTVWTGVSLRCGEREKTFAVATDVYFRPCEERELLTYIATGDPMDKAGSYGVQGFAGVFVERIDGDFYNVMGLPICRLYQELKNFELNL